MKKYIKGFVLSILTLFVLSYVMDSIYIYDLKTAFIITSIMYLINIVSKVMFVPLALLMILTLGLLTFLVNGISLYAISYFMDGFEIATFKDGIIISFIMTIVNIIILRKL